ncbi:MAG: hypothetical protein WD556_06315 [Actinomycetota bacterium]
MSDVIQPGHGLVFMKVGTHAGEGLEDIIKRKRAEIDAAGYALWGYGGNTCHPFAMVQPFARSYASGGEPIYLCMQKMTSNHIAVSKRAEKFSADGVDWEPIPEAISVLGSRYALKIGDLEVSDFELPLSSTVVAIGSSEGRRGDRYIRGRVDKGCLEVLDSPPEGDPEADPIKISLTARVLEPYAVLVK